MSGAEKTEADRRQITAAVAKRARKNAKRLALRNAEIARQESSCNSD